MRHTAAVSAARSHLAPATSLLEKQQIRLLGQWVGIAGDVIAVSQGCVQLLSSLKDIYTFDEP